MNAITQPPRRNNHWADIRLNVFRCNQYEMAEIAGVNQGTISKWEAGLNAPHISALARIRREARRRAIPWSDSWFFEEAC